MRPVEEVPDPDLLRERKQLNIDLTCGPGSTRRAEIEERLKDIDRELRYRSFHIREAEVRIRCGQTQPVPRSTSRGAARSTTKSRRRKTATAS